MSIVNIARNLSNSFPLSNDFEDSYILWLERLGNEKEPILKLDNGVIRFNVYKEVFIASQWVGCSEEFEDFNSAYEWVEAGCT